MKKKNLFMSMLAMASMLFATSCSQDEVLNESATDDFVNATFTVSTSEGIGTRAVGDGTTVNYVACAVYDANDNELPDLRQYVSISGNQATYSIRLVKGQKYRVAFFAYKGAADGKSTYYNMRDLKNIQILDASSNVEARDAFTNKVDVTAAETMAGAVQKDVPLKRPFAQLNLGADAEDIEAARKAGIEVEKSKIKVTGVYKAFNAFENDVAGTTEDMTFGLNGILSEEKLKADVDGDGSDEEFDYLALNYLLVGGKGSQKATTDVTFVWETANNKTNDPATVFKNVPVQTNYRTNIVGNLLTNPANFNITIDENFQTPDHFVVLSAAELADEMKPVNGVINLTKDYVVTDAWTPLVFSGNITIKGNGHTIQGLDKALVGRANGANITINDLTIAKSNISYLATDPTENALGTGGFISYQDAAGTATFNNCHLKNSTVNGIERAAGLIGYTSGNQLTVTNCTVEGCIIKATGSTGGIVAHTQTTVSISGSKVEKSTIESTEDRSTKAAIAGGIIGTILGATTFDNVTVSGNTVINNGATPLNEKVGRVVSPGSLN